MTIPSTTPGSFTRTRNSKASVVRRIAVGGALTLAALGLSVPAASAGKSQEIATGGGSVVFTHRGEHVLAYDENRDGYGVGAFLSWSEYVGGVYHYRQVKVIDGRSGGGPARRNLSVREGTKVAISLCYTKHGDAVPGKCSAEQHAEA